ncbi:MAG: YfhO family protein, partial [Clostridia bacterium]|nr:YfhO family protein [Clostridia bacterium]
MDNNVQATASPAEEKFITPLSPRKTLKQLFSEFAAEKKYLLLCFLVPFGIMGIMYFCMSVYHGGECVLVLDLNGQYVYFFEALRSFLHGDGSLLYSFGRALGGEFMGIFAYYLSSPFSL